MRGKARTPTAILRARGSWRAKTRSGEPAIGGGLPQCPGHLDEGARNEWRRLAVTLHDAGILTTADRGTLAGYCVAYSRWVAAEEKLAELGPVVKSPNGYPIQNPWLAIANKAMEQLKGFAAELGITPAARSRVHVTLKTHGVDARARGIGRFLA